MLFLKEKYVHFSIFYTKNIYIHYLLKYFAMTIFIMIPALHFIQVGKNINATCSFKINIIFKYKFFLFNSANTVIGY